jgi:hypothetical protein
MTGIIGWESHTLMRREDQDRELSHLSHTGFGEDATAFGATNLT